MTDERIRKLERSARQGDEDAVSRLAHERRRTVASGPGASAAVVTPALQVALETSRYGTPEPSFLVRFPSRTHFRAAHAALHELAAAVERATPPGEGWIVQLEPGDNRARLYLELATADPAETDRGLTLLRDVVAAAQREGRATH